MGGRCSLPERAWLFFQFLEVEAGGTLVARNLLTKGASVTAVVLQKCCTPLYGNMAAEIAPYHITVHLPNPEQDALGSTDQLVVQKTCLRHTPGAQQPVSCTGYHNLHGPFRFVGESRLGFFRPHGHRESGTPTGVRRRKGVTTFFVSSQELHVGKMKKGRYRVRWMGGRGGSIADFTGKQDGQKRPLELAPLQSVSRGALHPCTRAASRLLCTRLLPLSPVLIANQPCTVYTGVLKCYWSSLCDFIRSIAIHSHHLPIRFKEHHARHAAEPVIDVPSPLEADRDRDNNAGLIHTAKTDQAKTELRRDPLVFTDQLQPASAHTCTLSIKISSSPSPVHGTDYTRSKRPGLGILCQSRMKDWEPGRRIGYSVCSSFRCVRSERLYDDYLTAVQRLDTPAVPMTQLFLETRDWWSKETASSKLMISRQFSCGSNL
ncbi:hypothetical protein RRG08_032964 [Elysia crispata]|uniref:Uncharacterized protein n=1 Tax=Elysia crispata TaxID=231223 RepID=A0AAE0YT65_9GAST|nr:hypothetical protein RRG08_032964 [Elysia crispata]